jgi:hypothetical protein
MTSGQGREMRLRIVLEFDREDQPRLFDDLMRFPKGTRRVNRLRFLAQDGLMLAQMPPGLAFPPRPRSAHTPAGDGDTSITDAIFGQGDDA